MKVVAFNGSARKDGNTAILISEVLKVLDKEGIESRLVQLAGESLSGCVACRKCFSSKDKKCALTDDALNDYIAMMIEADGIIFGSPVYFADLTVLMKALIERSGMVARANNDMFRHKIGAAVVAVRRAGAIHAFDSINHFFSISQMVTVGSSYWNIGVGREIADVNKDEEGLGTMRVLGENMAWLIKKCSRE